MARTIDFEELKKELLNHLPPIFARKEVPQLLGNAIDDRTLANLQCRGMGPPSISNGKKSLFEKSSFVEWLIEYLKGKNPYSAPSMEIINSN